MRNIFTLALAFAVSLSAASMGCGKGKATTTGGGGTGGTTSTGATGGTGGTSTGGKTTGGTGGATGGTGGATTGTAGTGGAGDCSMFFMNPNACGTCTQDKCCTELLDCQKDAECNDCLTNPNADPATCNANAQIKAIGTCQTDSCMTECTPAQCNPITNDMCDSAAGEACDLSQNGYGCFPAPNDVKICGTCDNMKGPFCEAGNHCIGTQCAHYCCDDGDCGTGTCNKDILKDPMVGVCVDKADATKPACDAPAVSPSKGSCFMP